MKYDIHSGHKLVNDPFLFPAHLKQSEEFLKALRQAKKHREVVLPYSDSRRLIDAKDLGVIVSARDYYNSVRKEMPDKSKPKTIVALLRMLEENNFIYRTRVIMKKNEVDTTRKLIQLFWAHRKQLDAAQRFIARWLIVINGTFNTNELKLPLLMIMSIFNTNKTFPVAFSFCPSESAESIGFI
jgi:hypothetical protein